MLLKAAQGDKKICAYRLLAPSGRIDPQHFRGLPLHEGLPNKRIGEQICMSRAEVKEAAFISGKDTSEEQLMFVEGAFSSSMKGQRLVHYPTDARDGLASFTPFVKLRDTKDDQGFWHDTIWLGIPREDSGPLVPPPFTATKRRRHTERRGN
jgi:hypothetical protein